MNTESLLSEVTALISSNMGQQGGEKFYNYHKESKPETIMDDAKNLMHYLIGPKLGDKKLDEIRKRNS